MLVGFFSLAILFSCAVIGADISDPEALKTLGNREFAKKNYQAAKFHYSAAISIKKSTILYRNSGMAKFGLNEYNDAETDFKRALELDPQDAKAQYWLGKLFLQRKELSKAIYFLRKAKNADASEAVTRMLIQAEGQFQQLCNERKEVLSLPPSEQTLSIIKQNMKFLGIKHGDRLGELCFKCPYSISVSTFLGYHWAEKKFVPLNRDESPQEIANLIKGKRVATPIVQTLPLLLSKNFDQVNVYDISPPQIDFHRNLVSSIAIEASESYVAKAKQDFKDYVALNAHKDILRLPSTQQIDSEFDHLYSFTKEIKLKSNITTTQDDIFHAVNNEPIDSPHDAVFLSTIPPLGFEEWPTHYGYIREWVVKGKVVVFSLLVGDLKSSATLKEFTHSFDDVAQAEYISFEDSPLIVHVKLSPLPPKSAILY